MKRGLLISAAVLFVLFAALWVYVESDAFSERIHPLVAGPLREVLGPDARIGRVKATLLPLVLEVRDVSVPSSRLAEAIAVRKIRLYINPFPLLYRTVSISSVTILEPRAAAHRDADGLIELTAIIRRIRASIAVRTGGDRPSYTVRLRSITVRNGRMVFTDAASNVRAAITRLNLRALIRSDDQASVLRVTSGAFSLSAPSYPPVEASIQATGSFAYPNISITSLELRSGALRFTTAGTLNVTADGPLDLRLSARFGAGILGKMAGLLGRQLRGPVLETAASIRGTFSDPQYEGTVGLSALAFGDLIVQSATLRFSYRDHALTLAGENWVLQKGQQRVVLGQVGLEGGYRDGILQILRSGISAEDAEVSASGTVGTTSGFDLRLSAGSRGTGTILGFLSGIESSGRVSLAGTLSGALSAPLFEGSLAAGPVTVRGVQFQDLSGPVRFKDKVLSITGATIHQDESRYLFDGAVSFQDTVPHFQARLGVIRSDVVSIVALFYKRIPLELSASGELTFTGTRSVFRGTGRLDLAAGSAYGESFDRGTLTVELTGSRIFFPRVVLDKAGGRITGKGWIGFDKTYFASIESSGVDLAKIDHLRPLPLSGAVSLAIHSSGSFSKPLVTAHASTPDMRYQQLELGAAKSDLDIRDGRLTFAASIAGNSDRAMDLTGSMTLERPYPWSCSTSFRMHDVDPSELVSVGELLSKLRLSVEGSASLQGRVGDLSSVRGSVVAQRMSAALAEYRIDNEGAVDIRIEGDAIAFRRLIMTGPATRLSVSGGLRPGRDLDVTLNGNVNLSLSRLLYREVEHGDGSASVHLAVRDEWASPEVDGRVEVRDGVIKIRDIPQKFTAMNGAIVFDRNRVATEGLAADVGGGHVTVAGSAQMQGSSLLDFTTRASVENVTVRYPPGLTATLGGTLYYDGNAGAQTLSGEMNIRRATYEKRIEWKSMLVDITRGITRKKKTDIGWIGETQLNVRFTGDEDILFESNLARIPLKIDVLFRGTVDQMHLLGRVEAREGEVYFRKNVFRILYASADFVDPSRINPVLDVQGETRVREYRIRLAVSGNADRAVVTFLSEPPLADSDILALLALGRTGEELKGKEANIGIGESFSFATGKFQDILERRARSLTGLDRFQVDPYINKSDTAVPRVTVGKEMVQDRLYMTYSSNIGGTTPEQNVRVEYLLNRNISLLGEYDELGQIGADIKFRFEFR